MPPTPTPQMPSSPNGLPDIFKKEWTMFYRHGVNAQLSKNFYHDGSMESAKQRAMAHCLVMGYKYMYLRPLICDIDYEEGVQTGKIDQRTGLEIKPL